MRLLYLLAITLSMGLPRAAAFLSPTPACNSASDRSAARLCPVGGAHLRAASASPPKKRVSGVTALSASVDPVIPVAGSEFLQAVNSQLPAAVRPTTAVQKADAAPPR